MELRAFYAVNFALIPAPFTHPARLLADRTSDPSIGASTKDCLVRNQSGAAAGLASTQELGVHLNFKWSNWHRPAWGIKQPLFTHGNEYSSVCEQSKKLLRKLCSTVAALTQN